METRIERLVQIEREREIVKKKWGLGRADTKPADIEERQKQVCDGQSV